MHFENTSQVVKLNSPLRLLAVCNYPTEAHPAHQVFVRALLQELVGLGVEVDVLAPQSIWKVLKQTERRDNSSNQADPISVRRPPYITYSDVRLPFAGSTFRWSARGHARAGLRDLQNLNGPFDACFSHFLYPHGVTAAGVSSALKIPAILSLGESSFRRYERTFRRSQISRQFERFSAVIANSGWIKDRCAQQYGVAESCLHVLPNGVNRQRFYPRDRRAARKACNLPQDRFIVISVGQFIERKGPMRTLEAIRSHPEIGAVFLGYGPQTPRGDQVLFQGAVKHDEIPVWLSAADAFVLPTLAEGCCNAVLEALSCGLPVISSDLPFNHAVLDDQVAMLVDPLDIRAIEASIRSLAADSALRDLMSRAALNKAENYGLRERAQRILTVIQQCVANGRVTKSNSRA